MNCDLFFTHNPLMTSAHVEQLSVGIFFNLTPRFVVFLILLLRFISALTYTSQSPCNHRHRVRHKLIQS